MKKIIIFLIAIFGINIYSLLNVNASSYHFYEGNYIQGIWMTKEKGGTKYYQKARFFMLNNENKFAYCVEPFAMFNENSSYTSSLTANNLNSEQIKRISLMAYFGYGYNNHSDSKWYAVTQMMIWQEADPSGSMYFTDSLNGNRINAYTEEINEINNLINNYLTIPSIANTETNMVENTSIQLIDTNNVLSNYKSDNPNVSINGNTLNISNLTEGEYTINLVRNMKRTNSIPLFYNSLNSQNMMTLGDVNDISITLKVNVEKTHVEVTKIDSDNKNTTSSGDASLSGAVYQIYDKDMNEITKLEINDDMKATIENLNYGKYYIKEIQAGTGYLLDEKIYEFEITHDNKSIFLELENKVIEKEIIIHKTYGDGTNGNNEANISFDILNRNEQLVTTITTDNNGYAKIILPFGIYKFKQKNTTPGYSLAKDFVIDINNNKTEEVFLYDYKIKVPNTSKNSSNIITIIILLIGSCIAKKGILSFS